MGERLVLELHGPLSVLSSQVTVWKPHAYAGWMKRVHTEVQIQGICPLRDLLYVYDPPQKTLVGETVCPDKECSRPHC